MIKAKIKSYEEHSLYESDHMDPKNKITSENVY